jgi:hypothetical protein
MGTARGAELNEERFVQELVGSLADNPCHSVEKDGIRLAYVLTRELPTVLAAGWQLTNAKKRPDLTLVNSSTK